jgi:hypothetical protein
VRVKNPLIPPEWLEMGIQSLIDTQQTRPLMKNRQWNITIHPSTTNFQELPASDPRKQVEFLWRKAFLKDSPLHSLVSNESGMRALVPESGMRALVP